MTGIERLREQSKCKRELLWREIICEPLSPWGEAYTFGGFYWSAGGRKGYTVVLSAISQEEAIAQAKQLLADASRAD